MFHLKFKIKIRQASVDIEFIINLESTINQ